MKRRLPPHRRGYAVSWIDLIRRNPETDRNGRPKNHKAGLVCPAFFRVELVRATWFVAHPRILFASLSDHPAGFPGPAVRSLLGFFLFSKPLPCGGTSPHRMKSLHHECQILQFVLQDRQSASGHFNPAGRIQSRSLRNSVPPPHQKDLQELGRLSRIHHAALEQVAP
jgi:hypothetical protein